MNDWILAIIAVVIGIIVGVIAARIVHAVVGAQSRPQAVQNVARPVSQLTLAFGVVAGLIAALGFVQPEALDQLPRDVVAFVPKLMIAAIIIILANVLASFATTALNQVTGRMPLNVQRQANLIVKGTIVALATLLAISQLGIDTEVINMGVAAIFFGLAASFTLLVGLGGHGVAREVAASRALRRMVNEGDKVTIEDLSGTVRSLHPTAIEVITDGGETVLVPSSHFLNRSISVERNSAAAADPDLDADGSSHRRLSPTRRTSHSRRVRPPSDRACGPYSPPSPPEGQSRRRSDRRWRQTPRPPHPRQAPRVRRHHRPPTPPARWVFGR